MKCILFLGIFSLITLVSCNKNEKKKITPDLLNCCFKTDTYWVYVDSVSNVIDSVYVVNYEHYYEEQYVTDHTSYDVEIFGFSTNSSSSKSTDFRVSAGGFVKLSREYLTIIYVDKDKSYVQDGYIYERLDSIFIYDRYYKNVSKVQVNRDENENNNKSIYYTNSEYGILRHDVYADTAFISKNLLMRKNIIR